jgi:hypothetical protein
MTELIVSGLNAAISAVRDSTHYLNVLNEMKLRMIFLLQRVLSVVYKGTWRASAKRMIRGSM